MPAHPPAQYGERAFRLGQRHVDLDLRARAGGRDDAATAAEQSGALFDAREPQPAGLMGFMGIEACAVVHYAEAHLAGGDPQRDMDFAGRGVADDVGEGLLGDPIKAERDVLRGLREPAFFLRQAEPDRQAVPPFDLPAGITEGFGKAAVLQDGRVELVAQAAEVFAQPRQVRAEDIQAGAPRVVFRELPAHGLELEAEGGEALAVVVMELAGDSAPRLLFAGDQPTHGRRQVAHVTSRHRQAGPRGAPAPPGSPNPACHTPCSGGCGPWPPTRRGAWRSPCCSGPGPPGGRFRARAA